MLTLAATKRTDSSESAHALRRAGKLPAVVYGAHHASTPISILARAFEKVLKEAGEATIISLTGLGDPLPTLIHEVDLNPLTNQPRHVDFYAVTKGEKVQVSIPLVFVGESPAVLLGANLVKVLHEVEIEADPMTLPHDFSVDLTKLAATGDQIHARDLHLPSGVTLITDPEEVVALIQEVTVEKEEEAPASIESVEVEKKGKEEESAETIETASE